MTGPGPTAPVPAPEPSSRRTGRSGRGGAVLLLLVLAGVVALVALPAWVRATGRGPVTGEVPLTVSGTAAAPGVVGAAAVVAAAALAAALVGRVGRWLVVAAVAAAGVLVVGASASAVSGASDSARRAAAAQTGVSALVGEARPSLWPYVAMAVGVLTVLGAVQVARASARWAPTSRRHDRPGAEAAPAGAPRADAASPAPAQGGPVVQDVDRQAWDSLTRGDDPS